MSYDITTANFRNEKVTAPLKQTKAAVDTAIKLKFP